MKERCNIIRTELQGYDYITDGTTGKIYAVHRATGEVTEAIKCEAPTGSIFYTPEDQERYEERKKKAEQKHLRRVLNSPLGNFYFVPMKEQFKDLSPESVTRLIYLNTYIRYNDNKLMLSERKEMKRKDLPKILNISNSTAIRFWKEVSPTYLIERDGGLLFTNPKSFKRGQIKQTAEEIRYQKFYIDGVRKLYEATEGKSHKQLGYLFKLLPFINIEFNLLCFNPLETELEKIELISMEDFCNLIDYDVSHLDRLLYVYRNTYFNVNGNKERFCAVTYDGINKKTAKVFINPHILYSGMDYKRVEILGAFCKA